jgi:exosortase/archaeosortase family protein
MTLSWKRLLAFVFLFGAFYLALAQAWGDGLSYWLIDVFTVKPAAWIARHVLGDPTIAAQGSRVGSGQGSLNVLFGCEGTDVLMLLAAALLVTPVRWADRLTGLLAGTAFVFVVNQLRLLALLEALRTQRDWFGALHGLVAPLAVVALVSVFFLGWLRWTQRTTRHHAVAR